MTDPHPNTRLEAFCDGVFAIATVLWVYWLTFSLRETTENPMPLRALCLRTDR